MYLKFLKRIVRTRTRQTLDNLDSLSFSDNLIGYLTCQGLRAELVTQLELEFQSLAFRTVQFKALFFLHLENFALTASFSSFTLEAFFLDFVVYDFEFSGFETFITTTSFYSEISVFVEQQSTWKADWWTFAFSLEQEWVPNSFSIIIDTIY